MENGTIYFSIFGVAQGANPSKKLIGNVGEV